jgi:hypothetical protein
MEIGNLRIGEENDIPLGNNGRQKCKRLQNIYMWWCKLILGKTYRLLW